MIVQKFGGSSVADGERMLAAAAIVRDRLDRRPVVVVSAMGGVTDLLVRSVDLAAAGRREELEPVLDEIERRHRWALSHVAPDAGRRHDLALILDATFEELRQLLRSLRILGESTARARDAVLAFGERLSSRLLAAALTSVGVAAEWVDPGGVVATDDRFGCATADPERTARACARTLRPVVDSGRVPVVGGFVGASPDGAVTTLGRGGGDTTAAVVGAALDVDEIQIWTDVDGLMTADPRIAGDARPLTRATFAEAAELAYYGAKVLHPASIEPAVRRDIPVRVRNTRAPERSGTTIVATLVGEPRIASVASRGGVRLVRILSPVLDVDPAFLAAVLEACGRHGATPDLLASSEIGAALAIRDDGTADRLEADLRSVGRVEVERDRAVLCVVGEGLGQAAALRARVLAAVGELAPSAVALGGSGTSVAAVIAAEELNRAVRALHDRFFALEERA